MPEITLKSSDGETFTVDIEVVKVSGTIKTMLEDCGLDEGDEQAIVPIPNINAAILRRVLDWAKHHKDDPIPDEGKGDEMQQNEAISAWDKEFLNVDQGTLFELILAANYLDTKGLLDIGCKAVANMIKGKSAEEIRKTFNIMNDFTAGEQEQVRKENEWCEKK